MTQDDYVAFTGQAIGALGMWIVIAIVFRLRAKERREKAKRAAEGPLIPPAAPEQDRPDWHGAPAGKPR
jgi:hypothetical protein